MKYEFSFKWLKDNIVRLLNCLHCLMFWLSLGITFDIFAASVLSFAAYIIELIIDKLETFKI